jgi:hypothetical protein
MSSGNYDGNRLFHASFEPGPAIGVHYSLEDRHSLSQAIPYLHDVSADSSKTICLHLSGVVDGNLVTINLGREAAMGTEHRQSGWC